MSESATCMITSCNKPSKYARRVGRFIAQWCETHGEEIMRCKSNTVDVDGACTFCHAVQGESCQLVHRNAA